MISTRDDIEVKGILAWYNLWISCSYENPAFVIITFDNIIVHVETQFSLPFNII